MLVSGIRRLVVLGPLMLGVLTLFLITAPATWAVPTLAVSVEIAPEFVHVAPVIGTDRLPISVGISFGHHQAVATGEYGILGAFASTGAPRSYGLFLLRRPAQLGGSCLMGGHLSDRRGHGPRHF